MRLFLVVVLLTFSTTTVFASDLQEKRAVAIVRGSFIGVDEQSGYVAQYKSGRPIENQAGGDSVKVTREFGASKCNVFVEFKTTGAIYVSEPQCLFR